MTNLIPKKTKVKVDPNKLTDSQKEIIRCLANGRHIYIDHRDKYRMSITTDPDDEVKSGHGHNHLYRPTIIFFIQERIVVEKTSDTCKHSNLLVLNRDYVGKYKDDIYGAVVEAALGLKRNTEGMKRI